MRGLSEASDWTHLMLEEYQLHPTIQSDHCDPALLYYESDAPHKQCMVSDHISTNESVGKARYWQWLLVFLHRPVFIIKPLDLPRDLQHHRHT